MSDTRLVSDLVGVDVAGMLANVTIYRDQYERDPKNKGGRIRKLVCAEYKKQGGKLWLFLRWERDTSDISDCGYSGWREDTTQQPTVEILEAHHD